jgi:hypothetical protein
MLVGGLTQRKIKTGVTLTRKRNVAKRLNTAGSVLTIGFGGGGRRLLAFRSRKDDPAFAMVLEASGVIRGKIHADRMDNRKNEKNRVA